MDLGCSVESTKNRVKANDIGVTSSYKFQTAPMMHASSGGLAVLCLPEEYKSIRFNPSFVLTIKARGEIVRWRTLHNLYGKKGIHVYRRGWNL
ncbi:hypothetical protein RRG08_004782 [Elysia crispata]|uniref:Uncharacterized protein n=1 Tax=Elysia crispata TaxID=231223 RepID=A0AAE1AKR7_9GAST|nr:hypothetical protein RRG08_004782 [Elysia crispata]